MLAAGLARRIVVAVLSLLAVLFVALAFSAARVAESRVAEELDSAADRVAEALEGMGVPAEHRRAVLPGLARLVNAEIAITGAGGSYATRAEWSATDLAALRAGAVRVGGTSYEARSRSASRRPERYFVLTPAEVVARRRADALRPIAVTGAVGLLVAVAVALVVARGIVRPVRLLAETAGRVASGGFIGDLARSGPGEIGDLEEAFGRMLRSLREGEARLRESERFAAIGRLASGVAHELRNPLTAVRIAVETALAGDDPDRKESRTMAIRELERLDRTLQELLDYARPRKPRLADLDAGPLLRECAALLAGACEHWRVRLEVDAPGIATLRADADRLKQAVVNLVLNGAQAQPGGGVVRLAARPGEISVADRGGGIPEEIRGRIFEPFATTKAAGIGLGLAVVKQIADEHGASVSFETGPDGTTFFLRFPS